MGQQLGGGDDHAGRAEAALHGVAGVEGLLQRAQTLGGREALDGDDRAAVELRREEQAAARAAPVHQHRAGAADTVLAAHVGAGEPEIPAKEVGERTARLDGALHGCAVDGEPHRQALAGRDRAHHVVPASRALAWSRARSVSTVARWRRYSAEPCTSLGGSQSGPAAAPARAAVTASSAPPARRRSADESRSGRSPTPKPTRRAASMRAGEPGASRSVAATPASAKSPGRRAISAKPQPGGGAGISIAVMISSASSAVVSRPRKSASAGISR